MPKAGKSSPKIEEPKTAQPKVVAEDPKPVKKIDLEITNPDDIKIDDKGQSLLF